MQHFDMILSQAAAAIEEEYFALPVEGTDPVVRERVYCYELYHRMRELWPQQGPYYLNGEVDKQNHPYLGDGAPKPDFLVHVPGTHNNFAAIEVKGPGASVGAIRSDINKLLTFRQWYERGVYLIYGVAPEEASSRITASAEHPDQLAPIELWVHPAVGEEAMRVGWEQG